MDLTILRWLDLQDGQVLELECGEDIDIVTDALLGNDPGAEQRLLEQVKHRMRSVTLRTPAAVGALAWAIDQQRLNPTLLLLFRYTTNAAVGTEANTPLPHGMAAITAWEHLRQELLSTEEASLLAGIRSILQKVVKPGELNATIWQRFQTFVHTADDNTLLEFIRTFEWSTSTATATDIGPQIQQELLDRGLAPSADHAQRLYDQLFVYVFKVLTRRGPKQLTVENRQEQLALPALDIADRLLLTQLTNRIQQLEPRVHSLEEITSQLKEQVQQLAQSYDINAAISYVTTSPSLALPPAIVALSTRSHTVQSLSEILNTHTWTALRGGVGTGKTQLGRLMALASRSSQIWIALRDLEIALACARLDSALTIATNVALSSDYRTWYAELCQQLGPDGLIILDDLPRLSGRDDLSMRLSHLAKACQDADVRLLTLSAYPLPAALRAVFTDETLWESEIPLLTDDEIAEVLQAHGASVAVSAPDSPLLRFLAARAGRHALVVTAIALYLAVHNWEITDTILTELLSQAYLDKINQETLQRLIESTTDEVSRQLLYRMSLSIAALKQEDLIAIAGIEPSISHPGEHLTRIIGLWIQRDPAAHLIVSPLVRPLGTTELSPLVQQQCHRTLGDQIVHRGQIDTLEILIAISHFVAATEFNRAGVLLILALNALDDAEATVPDLGLLDLWATHPLPEEMELGLRLYVRSLQIRVYDKRGLALDYLLNDLDALLLQATAREAWGVLAAIVHAAIDAPHANHYLRALLHLLPDARLPDGTPLIFPMPSESLLWLTGHAVSTGEDLGDWMDTLEQLSSEQCEQAFNGPFAEAACIMLADRLWMRESDKPPASQHWGLVFTILDKCAQRARRLNLELLWACFVRAQLVVQSEYQHDLHTAVALAQSALTQASDLRVKFLLRECIGRQYAYQEQDTEALTWLQEAIALNINAFPHWRMLALLYLSKVSGSIDAQAAVQYARQAVDLAETENLFPENSWVRELDRAAATDELPDPAGSRAESISKIVAMEQIKAWGELAIAQWRADDRVGAFAALDWACERLLASRSETPQWKDLFVLCGHVSGYFTSIATLGEPPLDIEEGVSHVEPPRGMFLTAHPGRAASYNPDKVAILPEQLAMFAEAVGMDERAAVWARSALDMAQVGIQSWELVQADMVLIPHCIQNAQYSQAVDVALKVGMIFSAVAQNAQVHSGRGELQLDVNAILGPRSSEGWRQAEELASGLSLIPIAFQISALALTAADSARDAATAVAAKCREVSTTAAEPELWATAAELFEQLYIEGLSGGEAIRRSNTFDSDHWRALQLVGYLGATLQTDILPETAIEAHATVLADQRLQHMRGVNRLLVAPFMSLYWARAVARVPFRFHIPTILAADLQQAQSRPSDKQPQIILQLVASNLRVHLAPI